MENLLPLFRYVEIAVFILLAAFSVWSISVMIDRKRFFARFFSDQDFEQADKLLREDGKDKLQKWALESSALPQGLVREMTASPSQTFEALEASAKSYLQTRRVELEKGLGILATLGSNAPFIGLFATVLGIVQTFSALSDQTSGSPEVMASIARALLATAAGLFVAIPAVVAFNYFSGKLRTALVRCEALKNLYISRASVRK